MLVVARDWLRATTRRLSALGLLRPVRRNDSFAKRWAIEGKRGASSV
jgi:hypothetical protein